MLWYENLTSTIVYENIESLLEHNPNISHDEAIIFLVNGNSGFGSQLTVLVQNSLYLKSINPKLHCLCHFGINNTNFKYHETDLNNSFFLYFSYLKPISDDMKYYFVNMNYLIHEYPFIQPQIVEGNNVDDIEINKLYSDYFKDNYKLKIGHDIECKMLKLKMELQVPLIGIHMRSAYQILVHTFGRDCDIISKFNKIKQELDTKYEKYKIFIMTDVDFYIDMSKSIFGEENVYYNDFINRVSIDINDSVLNMDNCGFKLGSDIIYDCISLVNCDYYYVSISNIAFISSFISDKNNAIHFN